MNTLLSVTAIAGILYLDNYFLFTIGNLFLGVFAIALTTLQFVIIIWSAIEDLKLAGIIKDKD